VFQLTDERGIPVITRLATPELIAIGGRYRAAYLVQQAGYTLGIAAADGEALAALLPANYLDEVTRARDDVDQARQDKTIAAVEAKQATGTQNDHVRALKVWRRKVVSRAQRALRAGAILPTELTHIGQVRSVPALLEAASKTLGLLAQQTAALDEVAPGTQPLIDEGRALYQGLDQADSAQERKRTADLPAAVAAFYAKKGELYTGLKIINDAGHELFAHDVQAAAKYNLSILHRGHGQTAAAPSPPAPSPAATHA
jgi:hypothetical protein